MIYYQKGVIGNQLKINKKSELSDFDILANKLSNHQDTSIIPIDMIEQEKTNTALYIIAGEMKSFTRSNDNVLSRSLLILDMDDIKANEKDFIAQIDMMQGMRFIAYPSINHNVKGTRYRLIFDISRPITTAKEYTALISCMTRFIYEVALNQNEYTPDLSNKTWAQLQGWYTKTEANRDSPIYIHTEGKPLPVDELIRDELKRQHAAPQRDKCTYQANDSYQNAKPSTLAEVAPIIFEGELYEGNRHSFFLRAFDAVLAGCKGNEALLNVYLDKLEDLRANRCSPPYPEREFHKDYREACKYVNRKKKGVNEWK